MGAYSPMKITGNSTGLVQQREEFLLPNDAYPSLVNAYVWRERILRKKGYQLLGRLQRQVTIARTNATGAGTYTNTILSSIKVSQPQSQITPGTFTFTFDAGGPNQTIYADVDGDGILTRQSGPYTISSGTINYFTSVMSLTFTAAPPGGTSASATFYYAPGLPVMGINGREIQDSSLEETIFFDQVYAYRYSTVIEGFEEFIPGTTWNNPGEGVSGTSFFWSTNYWVSSAPTFGTSNTKLMWVTNNTGAFLGGYDPVRITDGQTWVDFFPAVIVPGVNNWSQIDATEYLITFLCMVPFRGRMVTFNTWEGPSAAGMTHFRQRIRWSTIGNPFIPYSNGPPSVGSWRDDVRGQGGFLDIPTSEDIISVGFVRDNLVIYCERSTWQLRYTGRSIAPFQIERVNSELGTESTFSAVQFDTSLVGIGDKGIVECDSYKSERIDIKIPNFVFQFNTLNNGLKRAQGIRDFENRLAFWTVPLAGEYDGNLPEVSQIFPNIRLSYNYENDSWALFNDSLTSLGTFQQRNNRNWLNTHLPWNRCEFPWISILQGTPTIVGGNQQGFIERLDETTANDVSLFISNITPNDPDATVVTSPNHNMSTDFVIQISGIPAGDPYEALNDQVFGIVLGDTAGADPANKFRLMVYDAASGEFSTPQVDPTGGAPFGGYGLIKIRENFSIVSKKFNFLDDGQAIQMGYIDVLMSATAASDPGAISLYVYLDYNDEEPSNTIPMNEINDGIGSTPDSFFNTIIPTSQPTLSTVGGTKFWQRVFCPTRANFLTLEYTLSNAQMAGEEQDKDVQIDAQILWIRKAGRLSQI